jgi:hypothetical protein
VARRRAALRVAQDGEGADHRRPRAARLRLRAHYRLMGPRPRRTDPPLTAATPAPTLAAFGLHCKQFRFLQLAMERELASMWELSFVVPPDHGMHATYLPALYF